MARHLDPTQWMYSLLVSDFEPGGSLGYRTARGAMERVKSYRHKHLRALALGVFVEGYGDGPVHNIRRGGRTV